MNLIILFTVFGILFLAELGDKTQLIIFNLVIELEEEPFKIGIGASIGFAVIITIGIIFGSLITQFIPISIIAVVSGIVFIIIGILESRKLKELYQERYQSNERNDESVVRNISEQKTEKTYTEKVNRNPYLAGFLSIFIMELGDKSQILTISLASFYALPIEVWLGSFFALAILAWIGVLFGAIILKYLPKFYIKIIAIIVFISVGLLILISNLP
jgi:putative Ca2+/H+ antiporter (TMEM165/GDT1 family)